MQLESTSETVATGKVVLEYLPSGAAVIHLGAVNERVVTLNPQRIESLRETLHKLKAERPRGVIITGPHADMFTVGADINLIRDVTDPALGEKLARMGQQAFDDIAALPCPTVAAISGPCMGGGCELVLACNVRLISDQKNSAIGLPEIKLGILPGFGGTQRLPRLIGIARALDIILAGKTLRPRQALKSGLVNEVLAADKLLERANAIACADTRARPVRIGFVDSLLGSTSIGRSIVKNKSLKAISKETHGFYPAPRAALECALYGLEAGMDEGLRKEARELGRLITTPESKALVHIFFLTEEAKNIGKSARKAVEHVQAVVIGAGVMGAGIGGVLARNDCAVILKDSSEDALNRGVAHIKKYVEQIRSLSDQDRSFIMNRIELTTSQSSNTGNANFVIEAIFEELEAKKKALAEVSQLMTQDGIVATNTSSLSVTRIAEAIKNPARVVGMHFFNPVPKMPLVEIVRGELTSDKTVAIVAALSNKLGKFPIVVKDVPGFLVNRILTPYLNEAAFLLEEYDVGDIDQAAVEFGMPMGPIRLLDEVGLDVASHVSEIMEKGYGDRMRGPAFAATLVTHGRRGKKTGAGFYDFADGEARPFSDLRSTLKLKPAKSNVNLKPLTERLVMSLLNEAVRCLDEGVAGAPGREAANQIDLGSVMGFGFPPFRGGLLYYADTLGAKAVLESMLQLEKVYGSRFTPTNGIRARAESQRRFCE